MTAPEKPDALRIARWAWPESEWRRRTYSNVADVVGIVDGPVGYWRRTVFDPSNAEHIHAAEQVAVERGHRDRLYEILYEIVWQETDGTMYPSRAAFAPIPARALALHRLVCELEEHPTAGYGRRDDAAAVTTRQGHSGRTSPDPEVGPATHPFERDTMNYVEEMEDKPDAPQQP